MEPAPLLVEYIYRLQPGASQPFTLAWKDAARVHWAQRGVRVVGAWMPPEGDEFVLLLSPPDSADLGPIRETLDAPLAEYISSVASHRVASLLPTTVPAHPPDTPDDSLTDPVPWGWDSVDVGRSDRILYVHYAHGVTRSLHHVEVERGPEEVKLTVFLGLERWYAEKVEAGEDFVVPMVALVGITVVWLEEQPLAGRRIVDGAGPQARMGFSEPGSRH
jgi:hypothetical protein